ncbi:MAG: hypothetical protein ABI113_22035, partial [Mucilaginibacter sp.]
FTINCSGIEVTVTIPYNHTPICKINFMDDPDSPAGIIEYLKRHHVRRTFFYHLISLTIIAYVILSGQFKSGPCTPGFDILAALYGVVSFICLIVYSLFKVISRGKAYLFLLVANLLALTIFVAICNLS